MGIKHDDFAGYHSFTDDDGADYGSFEVFWISETDAERDLGTHGGWFWWACFPGCIPDGEPLGPFETSRGAYADAMNG